MATKTKFTRRKAAVKDVEESKPSDEYQQAMEPVKARNMDWNVIGFVAAAITLLGGSTLFLLGYSLEAAWYGYFGLTLSQVNLPVEQILVQSFPSLLFLFFVLMANSVISELPHSVGTILAAVISFGFFSFYFFSTKDLVTTAISLTALTFLVINSSAISDLIRKREFTSDKIPFLLMVLAYTIFVSFFLGNVGARFGIRILEGDWKMKAFSIITDQPIPALEACPSCEPEANLSNRFVYEPFALIAENDQSIYLVRLSPDGSLLPNPSLYIIPRSERIYLIPFIPLSITPAPIESASTPTPIQPGE